MSDAIRYNEYLTRPVHCPSLFTAAECERIIALSDHSGMAATVDNSAASGKIIEAIRKTTVYPLDNSEQWLHQRVTALFQAVNTPYFQFDLQSYSGLVLLEYRPGDFFKLHSDIGPDRTSSRKLSLIAFLSDPDSYQGGQFIMGTQEQPIEQVQGSAIVFPAFLVHRVDPVIRGLRHSLVCWAHGHAFR